MMQTSICYLMFLVLFVSCLSSVTGTMLQLRVIKAEAKSGPVIEVNWMVPSHHPNLSLTWSAITYSSQVASKEVGWHRPGDSVTSFVIKEALRFDQQYRVCLQWEAPQCQHQASICNFLIVPKLMQSKAHTGPWLYLVMGPVHSKNVTVVWGETPGLQTLEQPRISRIGFRITWRRVDGRVGHPGHASSLASSKHVIRGLIPGTRYQVCVGEMVAAEHQLTCDVITTAEDVPGPPVTDSGSCSNQAPGTHWRCDVVWNAPKKAHGRITGYLVEWKDKEGYVLMESAVKGVLCEPRCYESQVVNFHPSEVCVSARTSAGLGWESCSPIHDVSERILAFFELRVVLIISVTLVSYQLGPAILKALLRCCIRGLYRHVEAEKQHPV
nr:uncharacterized protein LOC128688055 [Cherax quadricarinatus]